MSLCCCFSLNKQQEKAETVVLENVSTVAKKWYASVPVQEKVIFLWFLCSSPSGILHCYWRWEILSAIMKTQFFLVVRLQLIYFVIFLFLSFQIKGWGIFHKHIFNVHCELGRLETVFFRGQHLCLYDYTMMSTIIQVL